MGNCFGNMMSHILSVSERLSMFLSACALITCMVLCLMVMLGFGIGLGYNYSFVDYKSRHTYVKGSFKKVRPTDYYGPGYYKPTTRDPAERPKTRSKAPLVQPTLGDAELLQIIREARGSEDDLPRGNLAELVKAEVPPPLEPLTVLPQGPQLQQIYFEPKIKPTKHRFVIRKLNNKFSVSTPGLSDKNVLKEVTEVNNHIINSTEDVSDAEAIRVDVAKVTDVDNSSISKTMMNLKQLLRFLTKMREDKERFSVQVMTL